MITKRKPVITLFMNIGVVAALWVVTFVGVRLTESRGSALPVVVVLATAAILALSVRLETTAATYITSVVLAFHVAIFGMRALFGAATIQGRGNHLAVLAAALIAVTLTLLLQRLIARRAVGV